MTEKINKRKSILVLHGPNLTKLGQREPDIYGTLSLPDINRHLEEMALVAGYAIEAVQSNHEGVLIDLIEAADQKHCAIIINPAGFTHSSVAIRDAIKASTLPVIEVHLSNIFSREDFRQRSLLAPVCRGTISGFGHHSYLMALWFLLSSLE